MAEFIRLVAAFNKERAPGLARTSLPPWVKRKFRFGGQCDQKLFWPRFTKMLGQAAIHQAHLMSAAISDTSPKIPTCQLAIKGFGALKGQVEREISARDGFMPVAAAP